MSKQQAIDVGIIGEILVGKLTLQRGDILVVRVGNSNAEAIDQIAAAIKAARSSGHLPDDIFVAVVDWYTGLEVIRQGVAGLAEDGAA
jgi:hypothetical protein